MDSPELIACLSSPAAYPFAVGDVEVHQTHISVVFLAGPYAYKVKKPVSLGFVDFSTLEKRRHDCDREVQLNRRLAPAVYLGVVPIVGAAEGVRVEGDGEALEWAVKMQRLPEAATLRDRLRQGQISTETIKALAGRIAEFHPTAAGGAALSPFGAFDAVAQNLRDIFTQSAPQVGTTVSPTVYARLQALIEENLSRLRPLIDERARRGLTCDMHGDLHLDHVYFFPDKQPPDDLVIIDCIEFNDRFRYTDPVADMAFAFMDLKFYGRRDLAQAFAQAYFQASGDEEGRALLPLYAAYRASVRASVEGMKVAEKEVGDVERAAALQRARAYWLVALGELEEPDRRPCLLLVGGLPGTGKSTLARALAERAGFCVVRSDQVRKELAVLSTNGHQSLGAGEDLYSPEWIDRTYAECLRQASQLLLEGKRALVDATFREDQRRHTFSRVATRLGVPAAMLICQASPEAVLQRLQERKGDISDADWSIYQKLATQWEAPGTSTRPLIHELPVGNPEEVLSCAMQVLRQLSLEQ